MAAPNAPILIGGTGRSGTTALQWLLGEHDSILAVQWESQFMVAKDGLVDVLRADFAPDAMRRFLEQLRGRWFRRVIREGQPDAYEAGLCADITVQELEEAISTLAARTRARVARFALRLLPRVQYAVASRFVQDLLQPAMQRAGARRWSEKTPRNILYADELWRLFPDMRFIHIIRDGRDVVSSMISRRFWPVAQTPDFPETAPFRGDVTFDKAVDYWMTMLDIARRVATRVPAENYLEIRLEDLVHDRDVTLKRVFDFLGEEITEKVSAYDLSRNNIGRWRQDLTADQAEAFRARAGHVLASEGYEP